MSIFLKISESISAISTKLKPLTQMRFLGPVGITAVVVGFIWQVSEHPEWFELNDLRETISNSSRLSDRLSDEEKAIAADIDSSAFLLQELEGPELLPFPIDSPITAGEGIFDEVGRSPSNSSATPNFSNRRLESESTSVNPLLDFPVTPTASDPNNNPVNFNPTTPTQSFPQGSPNLMPLTTFDANYPGFTAAEDNTSAQSPLKAAMDQYTQEQVPSNSSGSSSANNNNNNFSNSTTPQFNSNLEQLNIANTPGLPATPINGVPQPSVAIPEATWIVPRTPTTPTSPTAPTPSISPYQTNISITQPVIPSQPILPQTPTRTGAAITPDLQNIYNSYGVQNSNGSFGAPFPNNTVPSPTVPGTFNNNALNPQNYQVNQNTFNSISPADQFNQMNQDRSFSVPRTIPGRRIGGGEINTFANP